MRNLHNDIPPLRLRRQDERPRQRRLDHVRQLVGNTLRLQKPGFQPLEVPVLLAGGGREVVESRPRRSDNVGALVIREVDGGKLDVMLDGDVIGQTPWLGEIAPGAHAICLRGPGNRGTPPSSANVNANATTTLVLRATMLDSMVRVEPTPSSAIILVDGTSVGAASAS